MKLTSVAPVGDTGRAIYVEVDEHDVKGAAEMSVAKRFESMSKVADALVVRYLLAEGSISPEYAKRRLREIRDRTV